MSRHVEQRGDAARVVLAVGVDHDGAVVALLLGEPQAGAHRAADAGVERQAQGEHAALRGATTAVESRDPSSTTTTSTPGTVARSSASVPDTDSSSL